MQTIFSLTVKSTYLCKEGNQKRMPSSSEKQRRFMWVVHGVQKGKLSPGEVGDKAAKAARTMSASDVKDFLMQECGLKECGRDAKIRILKALKEVFGAGPSEPMNLEEEGDESPNVIDSTKDYIGDFENTIRTKYNGIPLHPQEIQAASNFDRTTATISKDRKQIEVKKSDDFGNNSVIVIKKLRDSGNLVFVAFIKSRSGEEPEVAGQQNEPAPEAGPEGEPEEPQGDKIKLIKSTPIDDSEGSEILTNFMTQVWHKV